MAAAAAAYLPPPPAVPSRGLSLRTAPARRRVHAALQVGVKWYAIKQWRVVLH